MAECIEREALIEKLRTMPIPKQAGRANTWLDNCAAGVNAAIWEVASFPAADVAPVVHGHWVVRFDGPYKRRRCYCSHCGKHNGVGGIAQNQEKPYCPNCGVKMDGGAE